MGGFMSAQKKERAKFPVFGAGLFLICFTFAPFGYAASIGEKEPIKETQTTPVPVTDELLNREGEPGPASPSFKFKDSADFFFPDPYLTDEELEEVDGQRLEEAEGLDEDWLFWEQEGEDSENSGYEPLIDE